MKIKIKGSHSLIALFLGIISYGCHFPSDIGFGNDETHTAFFTDTLSLNYSIVMADSAVNGNSEMILTGKARDPEFGLVEATSYFQASLSPIYLSTEVVKTDDMGNIVYDTLNVPQGAILDSLKLRLYCREFAYGDTSKLSKFRIHRLKGILNTGNYSAGQSQEYDPEPLAEFDFSYPTMRDPITGRMMVKLVNLPNEITKELVDVANQTTGDNAAFIKKFKGFAIVPDAANEAVYGFVTGPLDIAGANSSLIPYWHMEGDTASQLAVLNINGPRYSHLTFNNSNTVLSELNHSNNEVKVGDRLYLQGGSGISPKIDLSPISKLGKIKINRAVLEFNANSGTINPLFRTQNYFVLAEADQNNQQKRDSNKRLLYVLGGNNDVQGQYYVLVDSSKYLNIDITRYLQKAVAENNFNKQLLLLPASPNSLTGTGILSNDHLSRLVFLRPRLLLYYNKQ